MLKINRLFPHTHKNDTDTRVKGALRNMGFTNLEDALEHWETHGDAPFLAEYNFGAVCMKRLLEIFNEKLDAGIPI